MEQGRTANLRRVAPEMCNNVEFHDDEDVEEHHDDQADACQQAKDQLLEAEDKDAFDFAAEKVPDSRRVVPVCYLLSQEANR